jgi:hypothetical protein
VDAKRFMGWCVGLYRAGLNRLAPATWIPTQPQVDEWLEYYKLSTTLRSKDYLGIMANAFGVALLVDSNGDTQVIYPNRGQAEQDYEDFEIARVAFEALEEDRTGVGHEYLNGYEAARTGAQRFNGRFLWASNRGYSWYNGWAVGEFDRLWREGKLCLLEEKRRRMARMQPHCMRHEYFSENCPDCGVAAGRPQHSGGCGNQNAIHPMGKFDGAAECSCQRTCG